MSGGPQTPALQLDDAQSLSPVQLQPSGNGGVAHAGLVDAAAAVGALIDMINGNTSAAGAYLRTRFRRDTDGIAMGTSS